MRAVPATRVPHNHEPMCTWHGPHSLISSSKLAMAAELSALIESVV